MAASPLSPIQRAIAQTISGLKGQTIQMYPILILSDVLDPDTMQLFRKQTSVDGSRVAYNVFRPAKLDPIEDTESGTALVRQPDGTIDVVEDAAFKYVVGNCIFYVD